MNTRKKQVLSVTTLILTTVFIASAFVAYMYRPVRHIVGLYSWKTAVSLVRMVNLDIQVDQIRRDLGLASSATNQELASLSKIKVPDLAGPNSPTLATGPLRVDPANPRYFMDGTGKAILLTGSHTWGNFQDQGSKDAKGQLPVFDYTAYLNFLVAHNHNFFRLWTWEQSRWTVRTTDDNYWFDPMPYQRTGPGTALDGDPKFDLSKFNQAYFDRLRSHVIQASNNSIYVSIMLFDGWSISKNKGGFSDNNPWHGHPYNMNNNINGIDGDPNNIDSGDVIETLSDSAITNLQEAYIRKVVDSVNDLDNVLYEIVNESNGGSDQTTWQYHMINYLKSYEASKPKQHPVGMTAEYPNGSNDDLFASPADWISPNGDIDNPIIGDGSKVILYDTDHLCGICGDQQWVWKSFTNGLNPIFMDGYDGAAWGIWPINPSDPFWEIVRSNLGYIHNYAKRMDLAKMAPHGELASSGYCLANPSDSMAEYLVFRPSGGSVTVDLSHTPGDLIVEWFNPNNGTTTLSGTATGGGSLTFSAPFSGDAVLYLHRRSQYYFPLIINRPPFLETFNGRPTSPQSWNPTNWDVTVHSRDVSTFYQLEQMNAAHGPDCSPPPATHLISSYEDAVFVCHDHVMTAINAEGYGVIYLTPDQQVDFSKNEAVISWDMSTMRSSTRDWVDLWITPFQDNLQLPLDPNLPDLSGYPRNAIHIRMDYDYTIFKAEIIRDFVATQIPGDWHGYESFLTPSATRRDTFKLQISKTHIKFGMPTYNFWWIDANIPALSWNQGVVQFGHHSYNPTKACGTCGPNTWHWDNVYIAPPLPFTIIRADMRHVDPTTGATVHFRLPSPENAFLRFAGIGNNIQVSYDNGNSWIPAQTQVQEKFPIDHFWSYWTPMPAGVSSVLIQGQNWYGGVWMVRDISIWSTDIPASSN